MSTVLPDISVNELKNCHCCPHSLSQQNTLIDDHSSRGKNLGNLLKRWDELFKSSEVSLELNVASVWARRWALTTLWSHKLLQLSSNFHGSAEPDLLGSFSSASTSNSATEIMWLTHIMLAYFLFRCKANDYRLVFLQCPLISLALQAGFS